jgi:hypothetical protein
MTDREIRIESMKPLFSPRSIMRYLDLDGKDESVIRKFQKGPEREK